MPTEKSLPIYNTLENIRMRKDQLRAEIEHDNEQIENLWNELFHKPEKSTRGDHVASIISTSITAIDTFLLVRKLMKNYGGLIPFFGNKDKKKKSR
ncbi:MAG: hypothetical protein IKQ05_01765 [Prevotella sp.]|jgi:hypothetical protein|nr:hypothetical protein [Prevotella sp.]